MKNILKKIILNVPILREQYIKNRENRGSLIRIEKAFSKIEEAENVLLDEKINSNFKIGLVKDGETEIDEIINPRAYYPKYERFLKNNSINYVYYDIYASDWIRIAENLDIIIWHPHSDPATQQIAKSKIHFLEKVMRKTCLPSFDEIWTYEDKINTHYLYQKYNLPEIPTFITFSKKEATHYINSVQFPVISKIATGSSSFGVEIIKSKKYAQRMINEVFSSNGRKTYWPYQRQKNYVYFQDFIPNATYDLRVMVVGDQLFGYYRYPKKGDFKASGAGIVEKKEITTEALELAYKTKISFNANFLATDMLYDENNKKFLIIESSIFIGIDTCEQLVVNGKAGYYLRISENDYQFFEGRYWIQELVLKEVFKKIK
ncbi:MAG: hypothetical protein WCU90_00925 [Kiritimatiellia bacterium]|nr:hypothetical protein [Bacteroidales bacterium]